MNIRGAIYDGFPVASARREPTGHSWSGDWKCSSPLPAPPPALFKLCRGVCASSEGCMETLRLLSMTDLF